MRVQFANKYTDGETNYKQGEVYDIDKHLARHLLSIGKVRVAEEKKRVNKLVDIESESNADSMNSDSIKKEG